MREHTINSSTLELHALSCTFHNAAAFIHSLHVMTSYETRIHSKIIKLDRIAAPSNKAWIGVIAGKSIFVLSTMRTLSSLLPLTKIDNPSGLFTLIAMCVHVASFNGDFDSTT